MRADMPKHAKPRIQYSPGKGEEICDLLAEGKSLNAISKMPDMPARKTIHHWINTIPKFKERYLIAKGIGIDQLVEETLEIADNDANDVIEGPEGQLITNGVGVQRHNLRIKTRQWYAERLAPKLYSTTLKHADNEGEPLKITVEPGEAIRRILFAINLGKKDAADV